MSLYGPMKERISYVGSIFP